MAFGIQPVVAQVVQGQILDTDSGFPVEGALVLLLNEAGEEAGGYLTNSAGRFMISAPASGLYTLRAERIGYATVSSDPFPLRQGERLGIQLETEQTAIELDEIRVEGDKRCVVRPEEGLQVATVWEEARKALTVQDWTEREGSFRFQMSTYERRMGYPDETIVSETRKTQSGVSRSPIQSLPAEDLLTGGFVRASDGGGWDYLGPDASVLLSDLFLDTHCFSLELDPDRGNDVGLSFKPVNRGGIPDIFGTIWLDAETAGLRELEFVYSWAPWEEAYGVAEGKVEFENLPSGAWIIRRWFIRMPEMAADFTLPGSRGTSRIRVAGIKEVGGEILQYSSMDRSITSEELPKGALEGLVWDGTRMAPMVGAVVFLSGTTFAAETDSAGGFLIPDLPGGTFTAAYSHPRLDSLGAVATAVPVTISPGVSTTVRLGIPSDGADLALTCDAGELKEGTSAVMGLVREATSGEPVEGAVVSVVWSTFEGRLETGLTERRRELQTASGSTGRFTACGVPQDTRLTIRAVQGDKESEIVQVTAGRNAPSVVNLVIGG